MSLLLADFIYSRDCKLNLRKTVDTTQFKQELIDYLDYYNNFRIKAKLKGLPPALHRQQKGLPPALHRQQALSAA